MLRIIFSVICLIIFASCNNDGKNNDETKNQYVINNRKADFHIKHKDNELICSEFDEHLWISVKNKNRGVAQKFQISKNGQILRINWYVPVMGKSYLNESVIYDQEGNVNKNQSYKTFVINSSGFDSNDSTQLHINIEYSPFKYKKMLIMGSFNWDFSNADSLTLDTLHLTWDKPFILKVDSKLVKNSEFRCILYDCVESGTDDFKGHMFYLTIPINKY